MTTSARYIKDGKLLTDCQGCGKPGDPRFMQQDYCDDCVINDRDVKAAKRPWERFDDAAEEQANAVTRELFLRRNTVPNVGGGDR